MDRPILLDVPDGLDGKRVAIRRFRDEDAPAMYEAIDQSREHIRRWLPWADYHRDVSDTLEFIRRTQSDWAARVGFGMGIFAHQGEFLGGIGLHPRAWSVPSIEMGYWIRETAEGKGYVTEAARLATTLAFDRLHAARLFIRCAVENARSKAVPERLGFTYEGTLRNEILDTEGVYHDALLYSMIPEEYERARTSWLPAPSSSTTDPLL